jgi:hypothetical protein
MSQYDPTEDVAPPGDESYVPLLRQVPLAIIFARIIIVTAMSFSAALAIFLFVGGIWLPGLACVGLTLVFLFLMFFVERFAEQESDAGSHS